METLLLESWCGRNERTVDDNWSALGNCTHTSRDKGVPQQSADEYGRSREFVQHLSYEIESVGVSRLIGASSFWTPFIGVGLPD